MSRKAKVAELVKEGLISVEASVLLNSNPSLELNAALPFASYTNATRPGPTTVPVGTPIFNTDDGFPNYADGTNWVDHAGVTT